MNTSQQIADQLVGYSAFELFEECYEYNEDECFVADSPESLRNFLHNAMLPVNEYRIDPVNFSDFLKDYGCSCGRYALEPKALERFEQVAKNHGIKYDVEKYDDGMLDIGPKLFIVSFHGWQHVDE